MREGLLGMCRVSVGSRVSIGSRVSVCSRVSVGLKGICRTREQILD